MLTPRLLARTKDSLDTFMAKVRPAPMLRHVMDVSYKLSEAAFVIHVVRRGAVSFTQTQQACFKAVHNEDPDGWLLFVPDSEGHWVACADLVFATDLDDVLQHAGRLLPHLDDAEPELEQAC